MVTHLTSQYLGGCRFGSNPICVNMFFEFLSNLFYIILHNDIYRVLASFVYSCNICNYIYNNIYIYCLSIN